MGTIVEEANEELSLVKLVRLLPCQKPLQLKQKITAKLQAGLIPMLLPPSGLTSKQPALAVMVLNRCRFSVIDLPLNRHHMMDSLLLSTVQDTIMKRIVQT